MVKFNPKIANKFKAPKVKNKSQPQQSSSGWGSRNAVNPSPDSFCMHVMQIVSKALFDVSNISLKDSYLYFYLSKSESDTLIRTTNYNPEAAAQKLIDQVKSGDYQLFLDDERIPDGHETPSIGTCIVVRTCDDAIRVVTQLGCPNFMHLDYCLEYSTVSTPFVDWFIEKYTPENSGLNEDFGFNVHSHSIGGRQLLNRKLITFERMIWARESAVKTATALDSKPTPVIGAH